MMLYVCWLGLVAAPVIIAQNSSKVANCTVSQYHWTFNSLGQSPCYVADALLNQCDPTGLQNCQIEVSNGALEPPCTGEAGTIVPLILGATSYGPPATTNSCFCNTVWYSLISACGFCQNGTWTTWPNYSQYCNQTYLMQYPNPIPSNTSVPSWAYLNVTETDNTFDPNTASSVAVGSSSTASASFTSTLASTSTFASSTATPPPSPRSSKTNVGAITGGIIGCVFGGVLISALLFWLYTKRRASRPDPGTSPQTSEHKLTNPPPSTGLSAVPLPPSWTDTTAIPSPPPLTDSPIPVRQVYQDALQKTCEDPDDIPTSSTIPCRFRDEGPRGLLPNTEHHWGQVGQYYADIPEL
ncbi:hypothetical protein F5887DRAFT_262718 [Amanita rubescens]|nr:hypothetical protein F5887DRAFT_262718 [Amanita rubescens]